MQLEAFCLATSYEREEPDSSFNAVSSFADNAFTNYSTGRYKWLIYLASLMSASSYTLLLLRWHGRTNWVESLYIFPG